MKRVLSIENKKLVIILPFGFKKRLKKDLKKKKKTHD